PAAFFDLEPAIASVEEKTGDGDVRDADLAKQEAVGGKFALQIVERGGYVLVRSLVDPCLVAGFVPDERVDDFLVEEIPDEDVAQAAVREFLEPARVGAVLRILREEGMAGIGFIEIGTDHR